MTELLAGAATALWLGILTSISPCPLATNIAAVSYVGTQVDRPRRVVWAGLLYAAGRAVAYVAVGGLLVLGLLSAPRLSHGLQRWMTAALGPLLLLTGLVLLGAVRLPLGGRGVSESLQRRVDRMEARLTRDEGLSEERDEPVFGAEAASAPDSTALEETSDDPSEGGT